MIKRVHHIGIAVNSIAESVAVFERLLGIKPSHVKEVASQQVREAAFQPGDGAELNLLEPTGPESAIAKFLEKRGEGIHHICLEVDDVDAELKALEEKGVKLIDREGRPGAAGRIGFLHPKSAAGVLVELVQPGEAGEGG